jgi:glucose/arabinose dehydrogenase
MFSIPPQVNFQGTHHPAALLHADTAAMKRLVLLLALVAANAAAQDIRLTAIATNLDLPVSLTHAGDTRLFLTLQRGQIVIYDGTRILPTPFLDVRSLVACCGERGLLSVAFHPRYKENGFFFVYYTRVDGDIVVARYRVSSDPNRADPSSATILFTLEHSEFENHNGGQLQFGPDGYLYAGTGDGGSGGDPNNRAQTLTDPLGKLLRLDVDGPPPYIPPSNPFVGGSGARSDVWAYGLRNPWRFSFDRETGDLFIGDVGQNVWEEVDFQPRTSIGGENYGWRRMEATHCFNPVSGCAAASFTLPILEYSHADGSCSITGGYRYRGTRMPSMRSRYFYGDYCTGKIWVATQNGSAWSSQLLIDTTLNISSFGEDLNGELYVVDLGGRVLAFSEKVNTRRRAAGH